jgi:hypothetical protein
MKNHIAHLILLTKDQSAVIYELGDKSEANQVSARVLQGHFIAIVTGRISITSFITRK